MTPFQKLFTETFPAHIEQHLENLSAFEREIKRKEAYEVRPATVMEVQRFKFSNDTECVGRVLWTFTHISSNKSRCILAPVGIDMNRASADQLDCLWSKFETRN